MVGAIVVCSEAAPTGVAASFRISNGLNSHSLATATRTAGLADGASARTMSAGAPAKRNGNGFDVTARIAFASTSTPVCGGGADEWPPLAGAVMRSVA